MAAGWAGQPQWRILETRFGDGLRFLAAWRAWLDDPQRPRLLHFVALADGPPPLDEVLRAGARGPELQPLVQAFANEAYGLLPGVHRLVFESGHVLLTLCIGEPGKMLRQLDFHADAVSLHAGQADTLNLKALARCCRRGTRITLDDASGALRPALGRHGFRFDDPATPAGRSRGEFAPSWEPRGAHPAGDVVAGDCIVIGAGLAGAAAAASMARRGWKVQVLDAAQAACGASGLPAGLLVPHTSPDDNLLSRLSRDGVRATLQQARALLQPGHDWEASGVLEHHVDGAPAASRLPADPAAAVWSRPADATQKHLAGLEAGAAADWHEKAAWIRPARLVQAWLDRP
ncbi:MAG: FAD-dependent oxidoreductase, partial [Legionella sp.]|nr:FAD-dependent oxidoreductase [Legionella sp.]